VVALDTTLYRKKKYIMDTKNVLTAIILSTIIIVGWQVLVVDPEIKRTGKIEKPYKQNQLQESHRLHL